MNSNRLAAIAVVVLVAGCGRQEGVAHSTPKVPPPEISLPAADDGDSSDIVVYTTGEAAVEWPSIPKPLMEISLDTPEVPEQVLGPFSEDILPSE